MTGSLVGAFGVQPSGVASAKLFTGDTVTITVRTGAFMLYDTGIDGTDSNPVTFQSPYTVPANLTSHYFEVRGNALTLDISWSCAHKTDQTITLTPPGDQAVGRPFSVVARASSDLPVTLAVTTPSICTYSSTDNKITPLAVGTCTITGNQVGNATYAAAPQQSLSVTINKGSQTLTITAPDRRLLADGPFDVSARSSIGRPVTLSAAPSTVCTYADGRITPVSVGDCVVTATAAGDSQYLDATATSKTIQITKRQDVAVKVVSTLSAARVQAILGNQMGSNRQVDRLMDFGAGGGGGGAGSGGGSTGGTGFTADEKRALDVATGTAGTSRLSLGMGGSSSSSVPLSTQLGLRSTYDDDLTSPMRTRGPGGSETARHGGLSIGGMTLMGAPDATSFNFATSLRDVARAAQQQEAQRLTDDPTAAAMGFTAARSKAFDTRANPLDIWVEGRFMKLNDGRNGADVHGYSGLFGTGVDYVFNRSLLAGVSLSYDVGGQKSAAQGTEARGTGWLIGPYATVRLSDTLFWQSRAAWGRASNEVSPDATTTDSFASSRWLASSKLTGRYQMGAWQLRPSVGVAYMEETSDAYTSGNGADVPSIKTRVGTLSAGPEISYQYRVSPSVLLEPRIGAEAIWTFARDISVGGDSALIGSEAIGPQGTRGRVELGLRTMIVGGTVVDVSGAYDGIGAGDFNTITGRAVVRVPLN